MEFVACIETLHEIVIIVSFWGIYIDNLSHLLKVSIILNLGNHISNRNFHVIRRKQHRFRGVIPYPPMLSCRGENENRRTHNHEVSTTPLLEASRAGHGSKTRAKGCAGEGKGREREVKAAKEMKMY